MIAKCKFVGLITTAQTIPSTDLQSWKRNPIIYWRLNLSFKETNKQKGQFRNLWKNYVHLLYSWSLIESNKYYSTHEKYRARTKKTAYCTILEEKFIENMRNQKLIEQWLSPFVLLTKKDGSIWFGVKYREKNGTA